MAAPRSFDLLRGHHPLFPRFPSLQGIDRAGVFPGQGDIPAAQLQAHSLSRVYEAVAVGGLREDRGTVDAPIGRHPVDRKRMAVDRQNGREAVTHWRVLARYPGFTHVECRLETGRTHQIRVHLASIGHPLLGDVVYGSKKPVPGLAGQCLHARRLRFTHPSTGQLVELECPLPGWFQDVLDRLSRLN